MSKIIEVEACLNCPFVIYKRAAAVPHCNHYEIAGSQHLNPKEIPYNMIANTGIALAKEIPEWCPLEDKDDYVESNFDIDRKF